MRVTRPFLVITFFVAFSSGSGSAYSAPISVDLKGAGELVDSITKAISALPDLVEKSVSSFDTVRRKQAAFKARDHLLTVSRRLTALSTVQNGAALRTADAYLADPSDSNWLAFRESIVLVIKAAGELEAELAVDDSDFVLQKPYRDIMQSLQARPFALEPLVHIKRPQSDKEMKDFKLFTVHYEAMVDSLKLSIDKLNIYITSLP